MPTVKFDKYNFKIYNLSKAYDLHKIKIWFFINKNIKHNNILKSKVMNNIRNIAIKHKCDHIGTSYMNKELTQMYFMIPNNYLGTLKQRLINPLQIELDIKGEKCNFNCFQPCYEETMNEEKYIIDINIELLS